MDGVKLPKIKLGLSRAMTLDIINMMANIALAAVLIFSGIITYQSFDFGEVIEYKGKADIVEENAKPGDVINYSINYCKFRSLPAKTERFFFKSDGGRRIKIDSIEGSGSTGCQSVVSQLVVPESITPGKYYLHNESTYRINWIKERTYILESDFVEILPKQ